MQAAKRLSKVPRYIQDALKKRPAARRQFESLAPSHRRRYVMWIDSTKRQETKVPRLEQALRLLTAGKQLGLK
ncbi:MAG: YdeI/OmpD-associated family protein [Gemmatimonadetes bacterium]|nr:YdeI/OmpD-associated family protein [Gemmatimonadota bacterium]